MNRPRYLQNAKENDSWRLCPDEEVEIQANLALLRSGIPSPRTVRRAVLHQVPEPPLKAPLKAQVPERSKSIEPSVDPPPSYDDEDPPAYEDDSPALEEESVLSSSGGSSAVSAFSEESEPEYDAGRYDAGRYDDLASLRARIEALERPEKDAADKARARIAALETSVAVLRDSQVIPMKDPDVKDPDVKVVKVEPTLYLDAMRRAAERRASARREVSKMRREEAELELRDLARRRRALAAPGPFHGLMAREDSMARRKQAKLDQIREAEIFEIRQNKFKHTPAPKHLIDEKRSVTKVSTKTPLSPTDAYAKRKAERRRSSRLKNQRWNTVV